MCGIFGFFHLDPSQKADAALLEPMGASLSHRGPDDSGTLVDRFVALGHRRLSIIDLSPKGRQPMTNEDQSVWLVFNGEIYNFQDFTEELKSKGHVFTSQTDSEVILHLYEERGTECFKILNGMFAFALWDKRTNDIYLVRDHIGIKPLHYAEVSGQVIFGSEIKAVLQHPAINRTIDFESLNEYLSYEYIPAPRSIFRDIRKVLPGHYVHYQKGRLSEHRYWTTAGIETGKVKREEEYCEELLCLLKQSVRRQLIADVPLGAFLSGGIDSSTICALMQEIVPGKVKSFNIGFEEESFDESRYAAQVAKHLGTEHHEERLSVAKMLELVPRVMDYLDEPFGDASFFPTFLLSQFTRRFVKVSLSGDGGDELFAGYPTYLAHQAATIYAKMPFFLRAAFEYFAGHLPVSHKNFSLDFVTKKFVSAAAISSPARRNYLWLGAYNTEEKKELLRPEIWNSLTDPDAYKIAEAYYEQCRSPEMLQRLLFCDQRFYLQDGMLVKVDRASMAVSLESRVPFLDPKIIEFAARLPARFKLKNLTTKYLLKKTMAGILPRNILQRPKKGFGIPLAQWFRAQLKPLLLDVLSDSEIRRQGVFRVEPIRRLIEEHLQGRCDHRKKLYTLVNFGLWFRKYIGS